MYFYRLYDLTLSSIIRFPELWPLNDSNIPDVTVQFGKVGLSPDAEDFFAGCFHATDREAYLFWKLYGTCLVKDGSRILVQPREGIEERVLRLMILGPAMGILLHQRGILTLHASAVCINGVTVAFLAEKKGGKSTTAALLHSRGHAVVADDIVAVNEVQNGIFRLLPGGCQMKIEPDVAAALGERVEQMSQLHPSLTKLAYPSKVQLSDQPMILKKIFILKKNLTRNIRKMPPQDIFCELLRHSYAVRFLGERGAMPDHFRRMIKFANSVPVYIMERPDSLEELPQLARWIEEQTMLSGN